MTSTAASVERTYYVLTFLETLAASLIWGVNTLFLLDAGLSLTGTFIANAAFSAGMVLFEVPTGVVADPFGRRRSYLLGAATLLVATALYFLLVDMIAILRLRPKPEPRPPSPPPASLPARGQSDPRPHSSPRAQSTPSPAVHPLSTASSATIGV